MDGEDIKIEFRAPGMLSDSLKLQLRCSFYGFRYFWILAAVILVVVLPLYAMQILSHPWEILLPVAAGLAAGTLTGPIVLIARRLFRKPVEIKADIGRAGIKIIGNMGFSYEATWPNLTWIKDGSSAYVMRFNKLFVRLPKRGFVDKQEGTFRDLVEAQAPVSALTWKVQ